MHLIHLGYRRNKQVMVEKNSVESVERSTKDWTWTVEHSRFLRVVTGIGKVDEKIAEILKTATDGNGEKKRTGETGGGVERRVLRNRKG